MIVYQKHIIFVHTGRQFPKREACITSVPLLENFSTIVGQPLDDLWTTLVITKLGDSFGDCWEIVARALEDVLVWQCFEKCLVDF